MKSLEKRHVLIEETVFYEGLQLHNLFWQDLSTLQFYVSVKYGNETAEAALGTDPSFAARCYQLIRDGGVTPCTLSEVVADLKVQNENTEKTLYKI
ncbi:MAG: hypothetical protein E7680_06205 [Ruminococcaceae bacterium]|nr:hypothetical protein [Oscillospiraceae bacterium]